MRFVEREEEFSACNIMCSRREGKCTVKCVKEVWEEYYDGRYLSERYEDTIKVFRFKDVSEPVVEAKKLNEEKGVAVTIDIDDTRLFVHEGKVVAGIGRPDVVERFIEDVMPVSIKLTEVRGLREKEKGEVTAYVSRRAVEEWNRDYRYMPMKGMGSHPGVLATALYYYKYVAPKDVETTCLPNAPDTKGITYEEYGDEPTVNLAWLNLQLSALALDLAEYDDVAKEVLSTAIHEYAHFLEGLNMKGYHGSWGGETPYEALLSVISGKPIPAGSEAVAETFARTGYETIRRNFPEVISLEIKTLRDDVQEMLKDIDTKEAVEYVKGFIKWLQKRFPDEVFFDVRPSEASEGDIAVKIDIIPEVEDSRIEKYLATIDKGYIELKERIEKTGELSWEDHEMKEDIYTKAIRKLFEEYAKEHGEPPEGVEVDFIREGGFVTIKYPSIEIRGTALTSTCEIYDADVPPPPEW